MSAHAEDVSQYRLITHQEKGLDFLYKENFLTPAQCDLLIEAFERCAHLVHKAPGREDGFFDNRFLWISSFPTETERDAKRLMQEARFRAIEEIAAFYDDREPLYSDTIQIVKWYEGMSMPAHADNAHPDGSPHTSPHRDYASVVYLNDDYEGGELYIRPLRLRVRTKKGLLVGFRGDFSHEHGVARVTRGVRYAMPGWLTHDIEHRDPYSLEVY